MTIRVERTFELAASPERVWEFISDPEHRARSISVVTDYDLDDEDGTSATWKVKLPIPLLDRAVAVQTREVDREEPRYVEFVGKSKVMNVRGQHTIEPSDTGGCRVHNRFLVDGKLPGVETFFERNLDTELDNLEAALRNYLDAEV